MLLLGENELMKYTKFIPEPPSMLDDIDTHAEEWLAYIDAVLEREAYEKECADKNSKIIADDLYKRLAEAEQKRKNTKTENSD